MRFSGHTYISGNEGEFGAIGVFNQSKVTFDGTTKIINNRARKHGGGIFLQGSHVMISGDTQFINNHAELSGGAIFLQYGQINFTSTTKFIKNTAQHYSGGALLAYGTIINTSEHVFMNFSCNYAGLFGGVMYLEQSTLILASNTTLKTSHNHAKQHGGAIFNRDYATYVQCSNLSVFIQLPYCFLDLHEHSYIISYNDSAGGDGSFLFGGMLDHCRFKSGINMPHEMLINNGILNITSWDEKRNEISSEPFNLDFCKSLMTPIKVQRGVEFNLSIQAFGQGNHAIPATILSRVSNDAKLEAGQNFQNISSQCSNITYSIYSSKNQVMYNLTLYPDGPCHKFKVAQRIIEVEILPCPRGFVLSGKKCVCEERLACYTDCIIQDTSFKRRKNVSSFWMGVENDSLLLYPFCPHDYCTPKDVDITLDNLDIQCAANRRGRLCGECTTNYSLLLGSSRCEHCSSNYLALLIPFTVAGITLIAFLSFFRLTVANGMINSLILYANFVQVNKDILYLKNSNILTVFIAWLNLDLGIETCFFNGLDAYIKTWLQFAFPFYIWILISIIIFTSRYSMTISKLIGTDPIAVLATLILMSYTKILKLIIDVFSFVYLEGPNGEKVSVWLKDGNLPRLGYKHLLQVGATSLVAAFFFLPFTFLLIFGPCLYRIPHRKCVRLLNKIKPVLDSYYAPYKKNTRYWTGFLLLVRCILYIIFTYYSLDNVNKSFMAIIITFSVLLLLIWITGKIYHKFYLNLMEGVVYLNLIVLSVIGLANVEHYVVIVYCLVGVVMVTMIGVILYQFYILYIKKGAVQRICKKMSSHFQTNFISHERKRETSSQANPVKRVTQTVIELREPLLEN